MRLVQELRGFLGALLRKFEYLIDRIDPKMVEASGLFDRDWYLKQYPDVRNAAVDPIAHYFQIGWLEGRDPSPLFHGIAYLELHPDARKARINPLLHYLRGAQSKLVQQNPRVEADWDYFKKISVAATAKRSKQVS